MLASDAVVFQFPLWWYGIPAIMKGWLDRVWAFGLACGYKNAPQAPSEAIAQGMRPAAT